MNDTINNSIQNRYEFALLFDVTNGNPNGDPDAGNYPRIDPETGHGLITDVCLKRKVRNFVSILKQEQSPYEIYVKEKAVLNQQNQRAYDSLGIDISGENKKRKGKGEEVEQAKTWMCGNFYDIRTFGAVMSTGVNCGQVRGPIQLTFARSINPITVIENSITRCAVTTDKEAEKQEGGNRTMGRKHTVNYALYRTHGFISPHFASQTTGTGFNEEDLNLFWQALENLFEHDRSAARGEMIVRGLYVFKHESRLGNAPAHKLFERIQIALKSDVNVPRHFSDYEIKISEDSLPNGVEFIQRIG